MRHQETNKNWAEVDLTNNDSFGMIELKSIHLDPLPDWVEGIRSMFQLSKNLPIVSRFQRFNGFLRRALCNSVPYILKVLNWEIFDSVL